MTYAGGKESGAIIAKIHIAYKRPYIRISDHARGRDVPRAWGLRPCGFALLCRNGLERTDCSLLRLALQNYYESTLPGPQARPVRRRRESWREPLGRRPVSCDRHDARATNPSDRLFHSEEMPQRTLQLHALFPVKSTMVTGSINPLAPRTCGTLARPQR